MSLSISLTQEQIRFYTVRRNGPGVARLAIHLLVLIATATIVMTADHLLLLGPALLLHGIVMTFLFAPLHESVHRTAFRSPTLNRLTGILGGVVLVLPPMYFRHFHMAHHRHTQDPQRDPELRTPKPVSWLGYVLILSGLEYWYRVWSGLLFRAAGNADFDFLPSEQRPRVVAESRLFLCGYMAAFGISIIFRIDWLIWLWLAPAILGQPFLRAYLLSEHWGCPAVSDMWRNTRSTISNPLVRFLAWNMPYHAEHHACAGVPFYALPAFSRRMAASRHIVSPGYGRFHLAEAPALIRNRAGARHEA